MKKDCYSCIRRRGAGLLNTLINKLPFELHIPGYQFCGPGTQLRKRLTRGDRGINPLDSACREHDIAYSQNKDLTNRHKVDHILADRAHRRIFAKDATLGEKITASTVWAAMKAKTALGMGIKKTKKNTGNGGKKKKRTLPIAKRGGFLPFLLPALAAIGSLTGGAAGIAKVVNDAKAARKQLEEMQRHNHAMEGRGLYLAPYKKGTGLKKKKKVHSMKN